MITMTANNQMMDLMYKGKIKSEAIQALALIIASPNKVLSKFTKKGEAVILENKVN